MLMTGDRFDGYQDPDDEGVRISLLLFSVVALVAWLLFAECAESMQTVVS